MKPEAPTSVQAGGNVNEHVHLTWTDDPNTGKVQQYQISRRLKDESSPTHVATVSSGVQSWIDSSYIITGTESDHFVEYYVYAVYTPTGSLSDPGTSVGWASENMGIPLKPVVSTEGIPLKFSVGNYPNPFNPSTTIKYELPKDASVKMEIYDVMGRRVKTLLDGSKSAGYYSVTWNGRNELGRDVASGVYLCRFVASPTNGEKPFTKSGKLLLTR
ncbi:MAG: FlgD immunoglobulin-like domain containing protein [Ignavibacteria bacterium]|nr:FlgD immunoglobulin-like domain containing protein [Ignavibacteria bacterium]